MTTLIPIFHMRELSQKDVAQDPKQETAEVGLEAWQSGSNYVLIHYTTQYCFYETRENLIH